jgi:hypothetical protein
MVAGGAFGAAGPVMSKVSPAPHPGVRMSRRHAP